MCVCNSKHVWSISHVSFIPEPYELPVLLPRALEQEGMGRVMLLFPPERSGIFSEALHVCLSVGLCVVAVWHSVLSEGNL